MVKYQCENCSKEFSRKSDYIYHTVEKKNPCNKVIINNIVPSKSASISPEPANIPPENNNILLNNKEDKNEINYHECNYCKQQFTRSDSLKKHIKDRCRVKKLEEKKKENIFIDLINKEKELNRLNEMEISKRMEKLEKENKSLKNNIKKLEKNQLKQQKNYDEKIKNVITKNINSNNITQNNITQNILLPSDKLVKFGRENLDKIDNEKFLRIIKLKFGADIYSELVKLIHFNENYPEYQNVYLSDYNREKYMTYDGERWELNDNCFNEILQQVEELSNSKLEDIEDKQENDNNIKNAINKWMKYKNFYFDEDDEIDKKRKEDFMELVDKKIKNLLYNKKDVVINNYDKLVNVEKEKVIKN